MLLENASFDITLDGKDHSFDLIELEITLEQFDQESKKDMKIYTGLVKEWLQREHNLIVSTSQAWSFIFGVKCAFADFKKKQEESLREAYSLAFPSQESPKTGSSSSETINSLDY